MKKNGKIFLIGAVAVLAIGAALFAAKMNKDTWVCQNGQWVKHGAPGTPMPSSGCGQILFTKSDPANTTYTIEGRQITLKDGQDQPPDPQANESQTITKIFETSDQGDINGDGLPDTAVILTQSLGGSGTFYYIAAAIKTAQGYSGTNAVLLGDRIAPQTNEIQNGEIIVNYADRNPEESFSVKPSLGKSMYLQYLNGVLVVKP